MATEKCVHSAATVNRLNINSTSNVFSRVMKIAKMKLFHNHRELVATYSEKHGNSYAECKGWATSI